MELAGSCYLTTQANSRLHNPPCPALGVGAAGTVLFSPVLIVGRMIYLVEPLLGPGPAVREQRFQVVRRAAAALLRARDIVFSPIVHSHVLVQHGLPTTGHSGSTSTGSIWTDATKWWCQCWTAGKKATAFRPSSA